MNIKIAIATYGITYVYVNHLLLEHCYFWVPGVTVLVIQF